MTSHRSILALLSKLTMDSELQEKLEDRDAACKLLFQNYRYGGDPRGFRLTNYGLEVFIKHFSVFETPFPEGFVLNSQHLLYLDRTCTLPYHITSAEGVVVFETVLGVRLMMARGDLDALMAQEPADVGL